MVHRNITLLSSIGAMACSSGKIMHSNNPMALNRISTILHTEAANASAPMALAL